MASALKSFDKIHILLRACIKPTFFKTSAVAKYAPAIKLVIGGNAEIQRQAIGSCELICTDLAATTFPLLLKQMYDEDLIDEEVLLLWAGSEERDEYVDAKVSEEKRLALRAASTAFIAWLEEAESESEEE